MAASPLMAIAHSPMSPQVRIDCASPIYYTRFDHSTVYLQIGPGPPRWGHLV